MIYRVEAKGLDYNSFLGYATGAKADIEAYYQSRQGYGLLLIPVVTKAVPAGYSARKAALMAQKEELQRQMDELERQINTV